jgi:hypothetical protein
VLVRDRLVPVLVLVLTHTGSSRRRL